MTFPVVAGAALTDLLHHTAEGGEVADMLDRVVGSALVALGEPAPTAAAVVLGAPGSGFSVQAVASEGRTPGTGLLLGGPVLAASSTGTMTTVDDTATTRGRWAGWAATAASVGIGAVRCWPVRVAGRPVGALVALVGEPWSARSRSSATGQALADLCSVALQLPPGLRRWEQAAAYLQSALVVDVAVHQAVGMVAAALESDVTAAAVAVTAHAARLELTVDELARMLVAREVLPRDVPPA